MKRGFLNSGRAKAKLTKDTDEIAVQKSNPLIFKPRHGVVQNAGKSSPKGYETPQVSTKEFDPLAPPDSLDQDSRIYTTQPSILLSDTPTTFPDGWTECLLYPDAKALILTTPGFPAPLVRPSSSSYRLTSSPSKGLGLFSTRKISAGDLILSERPLTIAPAWNITKLRFLREFTEQEMYQAQLYEQEQELKALFDRLHPDYQAAYMELANSHQHDGSGPILGIMRTNGLGLGSLQTGRYNAEEQRNLRKGYYIAVCKELSRLNHCCSPNTEPHFDVASFSYRLFAARDISEGEELTISYTDLHLAAKDRQSALEPYGFQCTCTACRTPFESDTRRAMTLSIQADTIENGLAKLSLLEQEGLQVLDEYCETLKSAMEHYSALGDSDNASKYAVKLVQRPWSRAADNARLYTTPPGIQSHPLWMKKAD
ncbi:hypothetical protein FB451DRAFT_1386188 [Mycena latifolia]|nr:hypothetical protein FB451DRAFT_1386188 [Mycena latifolia]